MRFLMPVLIAHEMRARVDEQAMGSLKGGDVERQDIKSATLRDIS